MADSASFIGHEAMLATAAVAGIVELGQDKLYALSNAYAIDGRVSWHTPGARGYAPSNCYLLIEGDEALLIDTGLTVHEEVLITQLRDRLSPRAQLSVMVLREGEFDSMCNLVPIVAAFGVTQTYGQFDDAIGWGSFREEHDTQLRAPGFATSAPTTIVHKRDIVILGKSRRLEVRRPTLRLLNTFWVYDEATRCLFTSDMFGHVLADTPDGPWTVCAEDATTEYEDVRDHLLGTRYWWIKHAEVDELRRDLAEIFDRWEVETIAPAWGRILRGADLVARHYALVDEVLRRESTVL